MVLLIPFPLHIFPKGEIHRELQTTKLFLIFIPDILCFLEYKPYVHTLVHFILKQTCDITETQSVKTDVHYKKTVFVKCINLTSKFKLTCSHAQQNTMCNKLHKDFVLSYTVQQKVLKNISHHERVQILSCPPVLTVRSHYWHISLKKVKGSM